MVSALGINTGLIYGGVFALGGMLAGLAGALAAPRAFADAGHGFLGPDRILHRHRDRRHGLDPRRADRRAVDRLIRSFGSLGFPLFTEGLMYLFMVIVLVSRPTGLFGKEVA